MNRTGTPLQAPTTGPGPCAGGPGTVPAAAGSVLDSTTLLQGGKAVTICHNGERYRLQATRHGKLILTK